MPIFHGFEGKVIIMLKKTHLHCLALQDLSGVQTWWRSVQKHPHSVHDSYNWRIHIKESKLKWKEGRTKQIWVQIRALQLECCWQVWEPGLA